MDLKEHLLRQMAFSHATFGPGERTEGVCDHIRKELREVETALDSRARAKEWVDVVILALDGLSRAIAYEAGEHVRQNPEESARYAVAIILRKQAENEARQWPDWRTAPNDKAIEHLKPTAGERG